MGAKSSLLKMLKAFVLWQFYSIKNQSFRFKSNKKYSRFYAQFGEDRWIFEHINLPKEGVFVDVGAGHPIHLSNTYFFETIGWTGICIDADPTQYKTLKKERKNVEWAAIFPREGEIEFSQSYLPELSSSLGRNRSNRLMQLLFKASIQVSCVELEVLLDKYKIAEIDILNIDVEGAELEVWQTFDYKKHRPKVVIIEYYTLGLPDRSEEIKDFFSKISYQLVHTTCSNFIFLLDESFLRPAAIKGKSIGAATPA